ncbi:restriction endonuclease subunit R [Spirochaetia bacterium 38H-sp]|uniref:Restriction endonuclease subunit R n=1 Tax=Rarispira pelagica TaxID=3141764 RepID=A0ABU9UEL6_9SPIR
MNEEMFNLIEDLKKDRRLFSFDEAATKQVVVLKILKALGWNPFNIDEIYPEYSVGSKRVDYALRYNMRDKVFIEVKKIREDLEKHQEQLLNYSFKKGVKLSILTNGISWWFYLPLREGSWEQRKFYTIEIYDQKTEDIVNKFEEFLSKENVISDRAVENAENLYKSRQKEYLTRETLPKAWNKIITEPNELLVELLADTTEKLCGYKPDNETAEEFLIKITQGTTTNTKKKIQTTTQPEYNKISDISSDSYSGKRIVSFTFKGTRYPVQSWKELLIKIVNLMLSAHKEQFNIVLNLAGQKRPYFTRNPNELRNPEKIDNTDIYIETNLSANSIVKLSKRIIASFEYNEEDFFIEAQ